MSKPSAPKKFMPAGWVVVGSIIAVAVGAASLRIPNGSATQPVAAATVQGPALSTSQRSRVRASLSALPLAFEANQGQTDAQVKYMARGNGYTVFLTANDTILALSSSSQPANSQVIGKRGLLQENTAPKEAAKRQTAAIHLHLIGRNTQAKMAAASPLPGHANYFIGNDRSQWHANVAQYARVSYRDVYPGVNMAFYGLQTQLEFDFVVHPGATPSPIRLGFSGASRIATDDSGNLVLASAAGDVLLHKPIAYQEKDGSRQTVDARFVLKTNNEVAFELGNYDRSRELVIDPSVSYATYLGGTAEDDGYAVAVDASGNAYVTGQTKSTDFPSAKPLQASNGGGFDAFVTELSPTGTLLYSTYIGGSADDSGNAIAVDGAGDVFIAGGTGSSNFPTQGPLQSFKGVVDAYVLELNPTGSALTYSTFLGGTGSDVATGLAIDADGSAYIVGSTTSTDFPLQSPIQATLPGASSGFVTKLSAGGSAKVYSTYLGGSNADFAVAVALDSSKNAYVTGGTNSPDFPSTAGAFQVTCGTDNTCNGALYDAFVSVINSTGSGFVYSTFLGGELNDTGLGIAVDGTGNAYVTGFTSSSAHFPLKSALQGTFGGGTLDSFVTELNPTGTGLIYSTYLGGNGDDTAVAIVLDGSNNAYITGQTASTNFPVASPTQSANKGQNDAFVSEISAGGSSLLFSTYLGGSLNENTSAANGGGAIGAIAVDTAGANIYVTGNTTSTDFPTHSALQPAIGGGSGTDAFVAKYSQSGSVAGFTVANGALSATSGTAGASATSTVTVGSVNGFNSAVTLACSVAPVVAKGPTCSFNPSTPVTPPANSTVPATLTISTTAATALLGRPAGSRSSGIFYAWLLPIFGLTILSAGTRYGSSRPRKLFGLLVLGLMLTGFLLMPACGGSSSGGGGGSSGTPPGAYTITVTGTGGGATVTGSPALTFTVN